MRDLLVERLKTALEEEDYTLRDDPGGPAIAFVVNYSRLDADLKRDLKNGEQFHSCWFSKQRVSVSSSQGKSP